MQVDNERLKSFALDAGLVNEQQIDKAIEEGANMIRVGTIIFGPRPSG